MPSRVSGAATLRYVLWNWRPCVRSITQLPLACTCSPAAIAAAWPTTVTGSRKAFTDTRARRTPTLDCGR